MKNSTANKRKQVPAPGILWLELTLYSRFFERELWRTFLGINIKSSSDISRYSYYVDYPPWGMAN